MDTSSPASPLVSIVIPTFNRAAYLADAIDSVLAQDYPRIELIVVDDGSTDDTASVLRRHAGRCRCERQENLGQSQAINRGWALSRGELLGYLGDDDLLQPGAIRAAVDALAARPDAVMAYGDYVMIDAASRPFRLVRLRPRTFLEMARDLRVTPGPGALQRREAALAAGPWESSLTLAPDVDFYLRLGLRGAFVHVPRVQGRLRVHASSTNVRLRDEWCDDEPPRLLARFFERSDLPDALRRQQPAMMAYACLMATRGHLRAGRYRAAARRLAQAAQHCLPASASPYALRLLASGMVDTTGWRLLAGRLRDRRLSGSHA